MPVSVPSMRKDPIRTQRTCVSNIQSHAWHKPHMELFTDSLVVVVNEAYIFASRPILKV